MDLSKFKVEVYDLLAVIIPGLLVFIEGWITLRGWASFTHGLAQVSATGFTVLLLVSFALGPLVQEVSDLYIKRYKGKRFFKHSRDELWHGPTGEHVRAKIARELGHEVEGVDVAFDYCLTKLEGSFAKRDLFLANSDLARGMIVVCALAVIPLTRLFVDHASLPLTLLFGGEVALLVFISKIFWERMKRFRELSETPVFHGYLAKSSDTKTAATAAK